MMRVRRNWTGDFSAREVRDQTIQFENTPRLKKAFLRTSTDALEESG
jgi:hypothetical protein